MQANSKNTHSLLPPHPNMPNKQARPFRSISIIVPLNNPDRLEERQRNKKLYYLLRWLRYGLHQGNGNTYYRIEPKDAPPALPHGGYRLSAQLQMKLEDFQNSAPFTDFIARMQAESIAPAVYLVEHRTNGENIALPPLRICGPAPQPLKLPDAMPGTEIDLCHTPYFARQMLTAPLDKPVEEYPVD